MIYKYDLKGDELILYFDYSFEFSEEFNNKRQNLIKQIKDYIKKMKIKFNGEKVVIVVGGIAISTLLLGNDNINSKEIIKNETQNTTIEEIVPIDKLDKINEIEEDVNDELNKNEQIEEVSNEINNEQENDVLNVTNDEANIDNNQDNNQDNNESQIDNNIYVMVYRSNGNVINLDIEEYLIGVVGAEMPASFNIEALKAQAIVARTYTLKKIANNQILTDTVSTQVYKDNFQLKDIWKGDFDKYYNKIKTAVDSTKGLYITYNGTYIDAVYHSTSNGKTEDAIYVWGNDIPYLKSVDSPWDVNATSYLRTEIKDFNTVLNILGVDLNTDDFEILEKNDSGRVIKVKVGNNIYSGVELRNLLNLRSTDFDLAIDNGNLIITTKGYGHGVGMSEYGANGMANSGYNYEQILKHYYQGIDIVKG